MSDMTRQWLSEWLGGEPPDIVIVYDGDCPVCSWFFPNYLKLLRLGFRVKLINARSDPVLVRHLSIVEGIDLDHDAAVWMEGAWSKGGAALRRLTMVRSNPPGRMGQLAGWVMQKTYPVLRILRWLLLAVLNRSRLRGSPF